MEIRKNLQLGNVVRDKGVLPLSQRVKSGFYKAVLEIQKDNHSDDSIRFSTKVIYTISNVSISLQITSFLWRSDLAIKNWSEFEIFWRFISFTRIDLLCAYLNIISEAQMIGNSIMVIALSLFIYIQISVIFNKLPLSIFRYFANKIFKLTSTYLFLPSLTLYLIDIKSYFTADQTIVDYSTTNFTYQNSLNLARSLISLIILFFINFIHEFFSVEIRHVLREKSLVAKAYPDIDITAKFLHTFIVILYMAIYDTHPQLHQLIAFFVFSFIAIKYLINLPYYSVYSNKIKIVVSSSESLIALGFIIGYLVNDAQTILFVNIFVVPSSSIIVMWLINYRYQLIQKTNPKTCSCNSLELFLRQRLAADNKDSQVLLLIDKCLKRFKYNHCEMSVVWQCYYCIDVLEDFRLAFVKLSKNWKMPFSLSQDFLVFKCDYYLNSLDFKDLEDLSYLRYALLYEDLKKRDMELCINFLKFWTELVSFGDLKKLNENAYQAISFIETIKKGYEHLITNYPSSSKCRETYKTFLFEICSDSAEGQLQIYRLNSAKNHNEGMELNYFDENNGTLLISGNEKNPGEIVYSNPKFAEILGQNLNTIIGSNINTYIPGKYAKNHNKALLNFIEYCRSVDVPFAGSLVFETESGYLVEVEIRSRCTAIQESVFFLATIKKLEYKRHIILINDEGIVLSYSQKLPEFLNIKNLKMSNINEIFPFDYNNLILDALYSVNYRGLTIGIVKTFRRVSNTKITVFLVYESDEDMKIIENSWKSECEKKHFKFDQNEETPLKKNIKVGFTDQGYQSLHPAFTKDSNKDGTGVDKKIDKSTHSSTSTSSASEKYSKKILNESLRGIIMYKFILLFFVRFIQVITGVATSLAIYLRVKVDITSENEQNLTMFLGKVVESISTISVSTRVIDIKARYNLSYDFYLSTFENEVNELDQLIYNLSVYSKTLWFDCEASSFLHKNLMPVAYFNESYYFKKLNLYDFLVEFNLNVIDNQAAITKNNIINKASSKNEQFFVLSNGIEYGTNFIKTQLAESVKCAEHKSNQINFIKSIILYIGISILCSSIACVTFFVINLSKKINDLWTFLSRLSYSTYKSCIAIYTNRLSMVNGIEESELNEYILKDSGKQIKFSISFFQIWKYIWRLLIFSGISIAFYLAVTLSFCDQIEKLIKYRPSLILDLTNKSALICLLNFYAIENLTTKEGTLSMSTFFPNMNFAFDPLSKIDSLVSDYNSYKNYIISNEFEPYIPSDAYKVIFQSLDYNVYDYSHFGIYTGLELFVQDTFYLTYTFDFSFFDKYSMTGRTIFNSQKGVSEQINNELKLQMNNALDSILILTVFYSVISLLLYFLYYIPYLNKESSQLKRIQSFCRLASIFDKKITKPI